MIAAALALGALVGLTMGALGGGGSILGVPALVLVLGMSPQDATTASLVIVGVTAVAATIGHGRSGHTHWRSGALLAAVGAPASLLGTRLNRSVEPDVLLLAFAALMLVAATGMLLRGRTASPDAGSPDAGRGDAPEGHDGGGEPARGPRRIAGEPVARATSVAVGVTARRRRVPVVRLAAAGLAVGFLAGFLGIGGGFVVVPVLVVLLGMPMPVAVGTSLLVIAVNCAVALAARLGHMGLAWEVVVPFTLAAVAASLAGKRVAARTDEGALTTAFAVLLLLVAAYVIVRTAVSVA